MSVINSMLRDLDRRHAPLPINAHIQPTAVKNNRAWLRWVIALCAVIIAAVWSWSYQSAHFIARTPDKLPLPATPAQPQKEAGGEGNRSTETPAAAISHSLAVEEKSSTQTIAEVPLIREAEISPETSPATSAVTPAPLLEPVQNRPEEGSKAAENDPGAAIEQPALIIKQERRQPDDVNSERYQLARAALAQNQPQRAYELLRDSPPPLVDATDYHAVLAAVEQQLGHYADASLRYRQLLMLDQNQASWWLGLALSCDGEHRNSEALAAYQHAAALNSLPVAARQYVTARIAALGSASGPTEVGN